MSTAMNSLVHKSEVRLVTHAITDEAIEATERKVHLFTREPIRLITVYGCNDAVRDGTCSATISGVNSFVEVFNRQPEYE